jgi:hypothetical protein
MLTPFSHEVAIAGITRVAHQHFVADIEQGAEYEP